MLNILFWIILSVILYSYVGYTFVLLLISIFIKRKKVNLLPDSELPAISLVIAAYNEKELIPEKIHNSQELNYPKDKLQFVWVTDGSTDGSEIELEKYHGVKVLHETERKGKMAAISRAMQFVNTPTTVFCDVNTFLHPDSLKWLASSLVDEKTGCVAGEKSIIRSKNDNAAGAGEGFYWRYESLIKRLESQVGSTVGAAGELYAIKTELFEAPDNNEVIDDFLVSFAIAKKGYRIGYQSKAIATEEPSESIKEEKKRKIRIAAGSFKVLFGKPEFLNIFRYGFLSFQYFSHKVLRWLVVPIALPAVAIINTLLLYLNPGNKLYLILLTLQTVFYITVLIGFLMQKVKVQSKYIFLPYYLIMMNLTMLKGFVRYISGKQSAAWEKAKRKS